MSEVHMAEICKHGWVDTQCLDCYKTKSSKEIASLKSLLAQKDEEIANWRKESKDIECNDCGELQGPGCHCMCENKIGIQSALLRKCEEGFEKCSIALLETQIQALGIGEALEHLIEDGIKASEELLQKISEAGYSTRKARE